ncbi:DUF3943 domain-containing protein [Mucilaginibacter roseus]|uniref:DUF3943 domain-containing protein n=1 Tax=Mucilaginibacter roseus TaxID=1528868 RepID=A0ABS8TZF4_9SPHI|nr:DUF3943 domain-containing protein [Mucilaginibacter roseus]MCD8738977.1 DUF3943 domain-containing protein [Mucilaginibacter roseus]
MFFCAPYKLAKPLTGFALLAIFTLACCKPAKAQNATDGAKIIADTLELKLPDHFRQPRKKNFWRAGGELLLAEAIPFSYSKFISKAPYANVTWSSIKHNIKPGSWTWDKDIFKTNQFGHPYHGSLYFNAFRSNGYTFGQSALATAAGSYLWETFGENEPPSPNDFVNTTFGGVVLGEMTHRLANRIVNNRATGFKRQMNEVIGFIVNPMNGLNRIIDGKWGKVNRNTADYDSTKISVELDLGARRFNPNSYSLPGAKGKFGWFARAKFIYGNPYDDYSTPFSNIIVNVELGQDDSSKVNAINVYGSIAGWELRNSDRIKHLAILSANYDYYENEAFFYGGQSVKMNLFSQYQLLDNVKLNTAFSAGAVILAAVPNTYVYNERNYDYTSGASIGGSGSLNITDRFFFGLDYRGAWLKTVNGNNSHYFLHTLTSEVRYRALKNLSVLAEPGYFILEGKYDEHPDVNKKYPFLRVSARYTFDL